MNCTSLASCCLGSFCNGIILFALSFKFKVASPRPPRQWAVLQVDDAKKNSKGQLKEHDCDVEKLKIQSMCKGSCFCKRVVNNRSGSNILSKSNFPNPNLFYQKNKKIGFAAKIAQDASKSGFKEALEAS